MQDWRGWVQFIFLNGGQPTGTDEELQARVAAACDLREIEAFQAGWQAHVDGHADANAALESRYPLLAERRVELERESQ
jgi:hypothetical protein